MLQPLACKQDLISDEKNILTVLEMVYFFHQISDPDYKPTVEVCHIKKYDIMKCIEQSRAKERRLGREKGIGRRNIMVLRRNEAKQDETINEDRNAETVVLKNHKTEAGFYSVLREHGNN